jgi:hypothetical protein
LRLAQWHLSAVAHAAQTLEESPKNSAQTHRLGGFLRELRLRKLPIVVNQVASLGMRIICFANTA